MDSLFVMRQKTRQKVTFDGEVSAKLVKTMFPFSRCIRRKREEPWLLR